MASFPDLFTTGYLACLPRGLFLLQEKLQDIVNILRKRKKEAQAILNHEKERVMLCKVSVCLVFGLVCGILSHMSGRKDHFVIDSSLLFGCQPLCV